MSLPLARAALGVRRPGRVSVPLRVACVPAYLGDRERPGGRPSMDLIMRTTAEACRVTRLDIYSRRRDGHVARTRQTVMWLARSLTTLSYPEIGRLLRRHHTTVMAGCARIERLMETDPQYHGFVWLLVARIRAGRAV